MSWVKKEARAFGKEFMRQGSIFLFGKSSKSNNHKKANKSYGSDCSHQRSHHMSRKNGYKK